MGNSQSHDQQQTTSTLDGESENFEDFEIIQPIVVTGFGKIYPDEASDDSNLSWRVVKKLNKTIIDSRKRAIPVIKGIPNREDKSILEPVKVCYNSVEDPYFQNWLSSTDALVYVHLGVNGKLGLVQLETTGRRRGVHFKKDNYRHDEDDTPLYLPPADRIERPRHLYPDLNLESESSDKEPQTSFQISDELCDDLEAFKSEITFPMSCSKKPLKLIYRKSDDAGNFLCDFLYYVSLSLAPKKNVLFVHIPDALPIDIPDDCYNQCMSEKADALAEVVELLVKKLLEQIDAAKDHTAATVEQ